MLQFPRHECSEGRKNYETAILHIIFRKFIFRDEARLNFHHGTIVSDGEQKNILKENFSCTVIIKSFFRLILFYLCVKYILVYLRWPFKMNWIIFLRGRVIIHAFINLVYPNVEKNSPLKGKIKAEKSSRGDENN